MMTARELNLASRTHDLGRDLPYPRVARSVEVTLSGVRQPDLRDGLQLPGPPQPVRLGRRAVIRTHSSNTGRHRESRPIAPSLSTMRVRSQSCPRWAVSPAASTAR